MIYSGRGIEFSFIIAKGDLYKNESNHSKTKMMKKKLQFLKIRLLRLLCGLALIFSMLNLLLKDAASSAIYGSRAANGVILVTTKTGKKAGSMWNTAIMQEFNKSLPCRMW